MHKSLLPAVVFLNGPFCKSMSWVFVNQPSQRVCQIFSSCILVCNSLQVCETCTISFTWILLHISLIKSTGSLCIFWVYENVVPAVFVSHTCCVKFASVIRLCLDRTRSPKWRLGKWIQVYCTYKANTDWFNYTFLGAISTQLSLSVVFSEVCDTENRPDTISTSSLFEIGSLLLVFAVEALKFVEVFRDCSKV